MTNAEQTRKLVAGHLGFDDATDDQSLVDDLAMDSLDRVEIAIMLEEEFGIEISDDAVDHWQTVGDVVATVEKLADA